jgi:hypothetical protein
LNSFATGKQIPEDSSFWPLSNFAERFEVARSFFSSVEKAKADNNDPPPAKRLDKEPVIRASNFLAAASP